MRNLLTQCTKPVTKRIYNQRENSLTNASNFMRQLWLDMDLWLSEELFAVNQKLFRHYKEV